MRRSRSIAGLRLVVALLGLTSPGATAVASPYYQVTNLGYGWDTLVSRDDQGRSVLENHETQAAMPFDLDVLDGPIDMAALPEKAGSLGTSPQQPWAYKMVNPHANDRGTVIGSYPDGSGLGMPYVSKVYGYVPLLADGSYGTFVPLASGPNESILLNDRDHIIFGRSKLFDIATQTTRNISDLIAPEVIASLGSLAQFPDLYWGTAFGRDGSILARLQTGDPRGDVTLLLTPPTHAPEPSTLAMLAIACAGIAYRRHRRG